MAWPSCPKDVSGIPVLGQDAPKKGWEFDCYLKRVFA